MFKNETDGLMFTIDNSTTGSATVAAHGPAVDMHAASRVTSKGTYDLAWLTAALWRSKLWIILFTLLGAVLAALASKAIAPRYQSTAQMLIDPRELRVLQNDVTPGAVGSDSTTAYAESQARVLASDSVKMRLVESEHLDKDPEFGGRREPGRLAGLMRDLGLAAAPETGGDPMLAALRALEKKITVRRGERTFIIDITATSEDPQKAARLANALANAYLDEQNAVRSDTAKRTTASLTGRLAELREKLRDAEVRAEQFKAQKDIVGAAGKLVNDEQLGLMVAQLQQLRAKAAEAKAKYDQVRSIRPSSVDAASLPEAVASNTITALRAQLGAALNREADLLAAMGTRHPSLVAARTQVQDARRQIAEELARIAQAARIDMDRTTAAEKTLSAKVDALKRDQMVASRSFVDLRELEREVESSRAIYETFLRRARETAEQVGVDTTNARIITTAIPPEFKSGVSGKAIVALGALMGLGFGTVLALGRGMLGGGRAQVPVAPLAASRPAAPVEAAAPAEPAAEAAAPRTGFAARFASRKAAGAAAEPMAEAAAKGPSFRRFATGETLSTPAQGMPESGVAASAGVARATLLASVPKVTRLRWKRGRAELTSVFQGKGFVVDSFEDAGSDFAAAIRQLAKSLQSEAGTARNRKVLITSLRPGAGSSTIALNLALVTAIEGRIPLLIDAGRGERTLTRQLAGDATLGFQDVISGGAGLVRAALQDEETGVFFLPRLGKETTGSTALADLGKATLVERFFPATRRFDSIIIDGSALGTDHMTQAFIDAVDDIVLVVEPGAANGTDLAQIDQLLGANGAKLRGFVINRA